MQRLGILAIIALLSSTLVGPIGISFAEMTVSNSTSTTNSTEVTTSVTTVQSPPMTSKTMPLKPLTEQERIQIKIGRAHV